MPTVRHRTLDLRTNVSGTNYWRIRSPQTRSSSRPTGVNTVSDDVVGNKDGVNPFELVRNFIVQPYLNGKLISGGVLQKSFTNFPIDWPVTAENSTSAFPNPTVAELNALAWEAQSKANPSAPTVSVPTFLAELKDLPGLWKDLSTVTGDLRRLYKAFTLIPKAIRSWGDYLLKRIAQGHISWRWAIRPLISDVTQMLDFVSSVNKRLKMLQALQSKGKIRVRVNMGRSSVENPAVSTIIHSDLDVWTAWRQTKFTSEMWATIQYKVTGLSNLPKDDKALLNLARRLTYGITGYEALATLWEILPWSWLVDWFVGMGSVIQANNNTLFLARANQCLMRTTTSETSFTLKAAGSWSVISNMPYAQQIRKQRWLNAPTLPIAPTLLPVLDAGKWSILASLYVLNSRRRKRRGL